MNPNLLCCVCFYTRDVAEPALTVIAGYAVCEDHAGYIQDATLSRAIAQVKRNEGRS